MIAPRFRFAPAVAAALLALAPAAPARAQQGAGTTGGMVLQLPAGSRAPSLSGAYAAATGDPDVIFYNPAGLSSLNAGAAVAFEPLVEGMSFGSGAGSFRIGSLALGAGIAYLNGGTVDEQTPDPLFGGQRGQLTGQSVSASESAARLAAALPLMRGRVRVGAAAGFISTSLAGTSSGTALFDVGAQAGIVPALTVGASIRNLGGSLGKDSTSAPLPTEARVGLSYARALATGLGFTVSGDFVSALKEHTSGVVGGVEAGLLPGGSRRFGAVGRVGYSTAQGSEGLAPLQVGGGLTLGAFALDYTFQDLKFFGPVHRLGLRWLSPLR